LERIDYIGLSAKCQAGKYAGCSSGGWPLDFPALRDRRCAGFSGGDGRSIFRHCAIAAVPPAGSMRIDIMLGAFGPDIPLKAGFSQFIRRFFVMKVFFMPFDYFFTHQFTLKNPQCRFNGLALPYHNFNHV